MNWKLLLTARSIFALCVGVTALVLVIWFDGVWLWGVGAMLIAFTLMVLEWLLARRKRGLRREDQVVPGDVDYKRHFRN